ncbi:YceI family protein [Microbacterium sp. SYP-A9085]|uniref:YceI family protein n=1 Tax=Microbacterium sp. SYP-A9085 TaxID=2664454 RepID=UPI00129AFFFB|nr:YceI family protein [Microbacterium sp. SYP-A9085]MRH28460.1 YceI family protein [Microbacterium sp. SYP-A9085]
MSKRTLTVVIVAGVVVAGAVAALAGPAFYRDVIVGHAAPVPTLTVAATSGPAVDPAAVQGAWRVADGSYAGYRIHEVLNGAEATVVGRTDTVNGMLTVDGDTLTAASFTVDVASITTDQGSRDSYFRSTTMQTFRYPTATFTLTEPVAAAPAPRLGAKHTVAATGDLTLAGTTRSVTVTLDAVFDGERAQVAGSIPITLADYGIHAPSLGFVRVDDAGAIEFSLTLVR